MSDEQRILRLTVTLRDDTPRKRDGVTYTGSRTVAELDLDVEDPRGWDIFLWAATKACAPPAVPSITFPSEMSPEKAAEIKAKFEELHK